MNRKTKKKVSFVLFILLITGAFVGATQIFAKGVNYHSALGKPLFIVRNIPIYIPYSYMEWSSKYREHAPLAEQQASQFLFIVLAVGMVTLAILNRESTQVTTHGSSDWATKEEIGSDSMNLIISKEKVIEEFKRAKTERMYSRIKDEDERYSDGVVCGIDSAGREMRSLGLEHMITMAPTRSGKGVGIVIPTLLTWKGSVFVLDIKGENYDITSPYRRSLGHRILKFAPVFEDSHGYNPLAEIELGTYGELEQVRGVVELLIPVDKGDTFFGPNARNFLTGVILFVMYQKVNQGKIACLQDVYRFLTDPSTNEEKKLETLKTTDTISSKGLEKFNWSKSTYGEHGFFQYLHGDVISINDKERPLIHPVVSRIGADILGRAEKERSGIISSAKTNLAVFDSPMIGRNTSESFIITENGEREPFKLRDLIYGNVPTAFYFVVPPYALDQTKVLATILITQMVYTLTKRIEKYQHRLLLMIDEFPAIGKMAFFETSLAFIAGYGIKAMMITQSLNQLYNIYGKDNKIIDNCHIQIYYAPNDAETPKLIEQKLGSKTVVNRNLSYKGFKWLSDWSYSESHMARSLLTAAEISQLPATDALVFVTNQKPIRAKKVRWYSDKKYIERQSVHTK